MYSMGIDIGNGSIKVVILDKSNGIVFSKYQLHKGKVKETLYNLLKQVKEEYTFFNIKWGALTGTGSKFLVDNNSGEYINEVNALVEGALLNNSGIGSVIELGGQSAKFITGLKEQDKSKLKFTTNTNCSAGTGSFLEEQMSRLDLKLEDYSTLVSKASSIPRIAGRCSVFAKTDIIHHQQEGKAVEDILLGLCFATARNYKNAVIKTLKIEKPVVFIGGVAKNQGMIKAMQEVLSLKEEDFIIPPHFEAIGAIGTAFIARAQNIKVDLDKIMTVLSNKKSLNITHISDVALTPLKGFGLGDNLDKHQCKKRTDSLSPEECYLGIDVGSTSTNLVLIDQEKNVISYRYLKTLGRPIDTVKAGLKELEEELGSQIKVVGVGTTGSGRYLIGDIVGADIVKDEITAQTRGAVTFDPSIDTIFEIGGQDSKFISLNNGVVVDFEMNKVCAAGTGSFIEEQAKKLNLNVQDVGALALDTNNPLDLGERCTVFIETNIANALAKGAPKEDILSGLCYSIAKNYLNRVVGTKKIGKKIFFQGGVAHNQGVINAFRALLGKTILVPPFFSVTGAYGAAVLALEETKGLTTNFRGFNLDNVNLHLADFTCNSCPNMCQVKKVSVDNMKPLFYGARCDIFERDTKKETATNTDIFKAMDQLYLKSYDGTLAKDKETIGIPRVLFLHKLFPLFNIYFKELGFNVLLSDSTNEETVKISQEYTMDETCYPIKLINGHVRQLMAKDIDYLFLPSLYTMKHEVSKVRMDYACCYMQTVSKVINEVMDLESKNIKLISPLLSFEFGKAYMAKTLIGVGKSLGKSTLQSAKALKKGMQALKRFERETEKLGQELVNSLGPEEKAFVIITRTYGIVDPGLNMKIPQKLMEMGYKVLPLSALPAHDHDLFSEHPNMYWPFGQHILSGAQIVKQHPNLFAIYLTNHGCGPDTAIAHFFREEMGDKPYLQLEVDEHSSNVGVITRLEAFINSLSYLNNQPSQRTTLKEYADSVQHQEVKISDSLGEETKEITLFLPNLFPYAQILASIFEKKGINAQVLPEFNDAAIDRGRKFTITKEYFSLTALLGSVFTHLEKLQKTSKIGFLVPTSEGSEVYGQYSRLLRTKLDQEGYQEVKVISPYLEDLSFIDNKDFEQLSLGIIVGDIILAGVAKSREKYLSLVNEKLNQGTGLDLPFLANLATEVSQENLNTEKGKIAVIGEPTVLYSSFMNNHMLEKVSHKGYGLLRQPLSEVLWFFWNDLLKTAKRNKEIKKYFILRSKLSKLQEKIETVATNLGPISPFARDLQGLVNEIDQHLPYYAGGFGRYRMAKLINSLKTANGVLTVNSLYENTGTILSILQKPIEEKAAVPVLDLHFDGQDNDNDQVRLETFLYYLKDKNYSKILKSQGF